MIASRALEEVGLAIEPYRPGDLDAMMEIEDSSFSAPWSRKSYEGLIPDDTIDVWVAWLGDELAGYYLVQTVGYEQELHTFAVKFELRGRGIGRALMDHMVSKARERKVRHIFLQVRPSNRDARELYKSLGFVGVGVRKHYYRDDFEDALVMGLKLE